jgi:predicted Zn-dependent peptidase
VGGIATQGSGGLTTVRQSLPDAIRLLAEIARTPSFPDSEFQTLKAQQVARMQSLKSEPGMLAQIALQRHMDPWPKDSPRYHETIDESIAAAQAVTLDQAKAFYRDFWGPQSGNLVVVGDFDAAEIRPVIEAAFGDWKSPHAYHRIATAFQDVAADSIQIETPDKANAYFFAQQNLKLKDTDADYPAMALAGYMVGGGFLNSRLASRIRQKDGLSYGVGGGISGHAVDPVGQFVAYAIYAPQNAQKLVADFREEIQKVLDSGFTADEVAAAKTGWLRTQQLERSQDAMLARDISSNLYFDRTFKYDADLEQKVKSLTPAQINAAVPGPVEDHHRVGRRLRGSEGEGADQVGRRIGRHRSRARGHLPPGSGQPAASCAASSDILSPISSPPPSPTTKTATRPKAIPMNCCRTRHTAATTSMRIAPFRCCDMSTSVKRAMSGSSILYRCGGTARQPRCHAPTFNLWSRSGRRATLSTAGPTLSATGPAR